MGDDDAPTFEGAADTLALLTAWKLGEFTGDSELFRRYLVDHVGERVTAATPAKVPVERLAGLLWWETWLADQLLGYLAEATSVSKDEHLDILGQLIARLRESDG